MSHPTLERHLKQGTLRPVYLFFGEEEFLMEQALRRLEEALAEQTGEAPHKVHQAAQEAGLEDFLAQARTASLWGSGQLLILHRVNVYPDETLKAILTYLDRLAPGWCSSLPASSPRTCSGTRYGPGSKKKTQPWAFGA